MKTAVQVPNEIADSFELAIEQEFGFEISQKAEVREGDFWTTFKIDFEGSDEEDFFILMAESAIEIHSEQK